MATTHRDLQPNVVLDVTDALSLTNGSSYVLQAQGMDVYLHEGSSAPDLDDDPAFWVMKPLTAREFEQGDENLYAWGSGRLVVFDAV